TPARPTGYRCHRLLAPHLVLAFNYQQVSKTYAHARYGNAYRSWCHHRVGHRLQSGVLQAKLTTHHRLHDMAPWRPAPAAKRPAPCVAPFSRASRETRASFMTASSNVSASCSYTERRSASIANSGNAAISRARASAAV